MAVEMVHSEAKLPVGELGHGFRTGLPGKEDIVVLGIYPCKAYLIDGSICDYLLTIESSMVIEEVRIHVSQSGEGEIDRPLSVSVDIYTVFREIQGDRGCSRGIPDALVADEGHSVIIDVGHTWLEEAHHIRERIEIRGNENILVDVHHRLCVSVRKGIFTDSGVGHRHRRAGKDDRLEISRRDVGHIGKVIVETQGDLSVRSDLCHDRDCFLRVSSAVGLVISYRATG